MRLAADSPGSRSVGGGEVVQRGPCARVILPVLGLQAGVVIVEQLERLIESSCIEQGLSGGHGQDARIRLPAAQSLGDGVKQLPGGRVAARGPAQVKEFRRQLRGDHRQSAGIFFDHAAEE